ncbi:MAG TPA: ATP-binding cassette domain-containing protein, partial [Dermatophilaceae bacterium]|nr:ATP-binding cassette domain-containing protein [Dermatophilaceae bacterium]
MPDQRPVPDPLPDPLSDHGAAGAVVVDGLTWRPYGRAAVVLDGVSFALPPGRRVLLAGASGSGKSTLLRALAGVLESAGAGEASGSVRVDGADPAAAPGSVGLVLQEPGSAVVASSLERDTAFGLENLQTPPEVMRPAVRAALEAVGLTMPTDSSTLALSGGEQQRLALAGALVMHPDVLLLDEPTAMLDDETAQVVRSVVDAVVRERGLTLVVAEHRLGPWVDLVDDLLVLGAGGAVLAFGPVQEVLASHGPSLLAEGVWVPGAPDPVPAHLDVVAGIPAVGMPPAGAATMTAEQVTVVHRTRTLHGTPRTTTAVDAASLEVRAGRTTALVGPSGSGKS